MRKHLKPLTIIFIVAILVGLFTATVKQVYLVANKTEPEETYEEAIQRLNKDVDKFVNYTEKTSHSIDGIQSSITQESISKNSDEEIIAMFVVDVSGSMKTKHEDKLSNVQKAIIDFMPNIGPNTYIGLVSYSTGVTINVPISQFNEEQARIMISEVINLKATGGTEMYEAIALGLKLLTEAKYDHPDAKIMMFVISDGKPSEEAKDISFIEDFVKITKIPVHTIGYGKEIDRIELQKLADINEATFTYVRDEDVIETLRNLFKSNF